MPGNSRGTDTTLRRSAESCRSRSTYWRVIRSYSDSGADRGTRMGCHGARDLADLTQHLRVRERSPSPLSSATPCTRARGAQWRDHSDDRRHLGPHVRPRKERVQLAECVKVGEGHAAHERIPRPGDRGDTQGRGAHALGRADRGMAAGHRLADQPSTGRVVHAVRGEPGRGPHNNACPRRRARQAPRRTGPRRARARPTHGAGRQSRGVVLTRTYSPPALGVVGGGRGSSADLCPQGNGCWMPWPLITRPGTTS